MDLQGIPHLEGRIEDLLQAGQLSPEAIRTRRVLPTAKLPAPTRLLPGTEAYADSWVAMHHRGGGAATMPRVNCYTVRELGVSGIGQLHIDGKLILTPETVPPYWRRNMLKDGGKKLAHQSALRRRRIKGHTLVFSGWGLDTYGHFLVEMLPRLLIARQALGDALSRTKVLLPSNTPAWLEAMVARALRTPDPVFERYDPLTEQVVLSSGIIPALPVNESGFHPGQNALFDDLRSAIIGSESKPLAPRLFITRALFNNPSTSNRRCLNEFALAEIAAREYGFAILAPETLPWETQIRLMAGASVIAGEFGSGLHGALFAPPETRVAVLGILNLKQSSIATLRGQRIAYMATPKPNKLGRYAVDEWAFRRFMDAVLR